MIRCPKGYYFVIIDRHKVRNCLYGSNSLPVFETRSIWVELHQTKTKEKIGYVDLVLTRYNFWETHSALDEEFHGKGLGVLMYSKAINVGLKNDLIIKSSTSTSDDAKRVWNSKRLNALFKIKYEKKRFHVTGRKA